MTARLKAVGNRPDDNDAFITDVHRESKKQDTKLLPTTNIPKYITKY